MEKIDWQEVADLNPRGYCEIQDSREGLVFHGPVESIAIIDGDFVKITLKWVAQMPLPGCSGFGSWSKAPDEKKEFYFPNLLVPFVIEDTPAKGPCIRFGFNIIYINPISGIDTKKVRGLEHVVC